MSKLPLRTLSAAVLLAATGTASANGLQLWQQNASGLGVAYAGSAAIADNASTIYYNPAGMTRLEGIQVSVGAVGIKSRVEYAGGSDVGDTLTVPNAYISAQVLPNLYAGVGISRPFGLSTDYPAAWAGAATGIRTDISTVNINPSIAYRVSDKISLGWGLNYQRLDADLTRTGLSFRGDDNAWGWNAGALFTLSPAMRVGISYRSGLKHTLDDGGLTAEMKLPDTFTLSVWQQMSDRWEAMGDLSYTNWSRFERIRVNGAADEPFGLRDTWRISWGAAYKASAAWKLKFGAAWERSPWGATVDSGRMPDNGTLWLTMGAQYDAGAYGRIDLGYAYQYFRDADLGLGIGGEYDQRRHSLGVQYSAGF